jgi:hypothetical protein
VVNSSIDAVNSRKPRSSYSSSGFFKRLCSSPFARNQADFCADAAYISFGFGRQSCSETESKLIWISAGASILGQSSPIVNVHGFRESKISPCLYLRDDMIILTYVDDCLFFAKDAKQIDKLLKEIRNKSGLQFTIEDDAFTFLGVELKHHDDGTVEFLQKGLIDKILKKLQHARMQHQIDTSKSNASWN